MNSDTTFQIESTSIDGTSLLGEKIAKLLAPGWVVQLIGDLGAGKTQLVRSIVQATDSDDEVQSPSFTIERHYHAPAFLIRHYDFHRLTDAGIMAEELREALVSGDVIFIEWPGIVEDMLGSNIRKISIEATSNTGRKFTFEHFTDADRRALT